MQERSRSARTPDSRQLNTHAIGHEYYIISMFAEDIPSNEDKYTLRSDKKSINHNTLLA